MRQAGEHKKVIRDIASLRACLNGVGDPGLVGLVSFVLCPPERENNKTANKQII